MKRAFGLIFLLVFFFSLWTAGMDEAAAAGLPEKLLRLRVVAGSDSPADQADKLLARDAVLRAIRPMLADCGSLEEVRAVTARALPQLAQAAGDALGDRALPMVLRLGTESCPRRAYEDFTLPAGEYETLTVTLGSGEGHNWWCVVFPPLCLAAAGEVGEEDGEEEWSVFSPAEKRLVTSGGVELRFRGLELWQKLRKWLGG